MAEYIHSGVKVVTVGDQFGFDFCATNTDETPDIRIGVVFKKSGLYRVSVDSYTNAISVLNVTPQSKTCDGCKHYPIRRSKTPCLTCSRRCIDNYEKEDE